MVTATACLDDERDTSAAPSIVLDAEFRDLVPGPAPEEQALIERRLHREGCHEPLIVWPCLGRLILLVGYELFPTLRVYRMPFRVIEKTFATRADAKMFVITSALARPNRTALAISYLRGLRYQAEKQRHGGNHRNVEARGPFAMRKTAAALAEVYHVSPATILRDAQVTAAVLRIAANFETDVKPALLSRAAGLSRGRLLHLAGLPVEEQRRVVGELMVTGKLSRSWGSRTLRATITLPRDLATMARAIFRRFGPEHARSCGQYLASCGCTWDNY